MRFILPSNAFQLLLVPWYLISYVNINQSISLIFKKFMMRSKDHNTLTLPHHQNTWLAAKVGMIYFHDRHEQLFLGKILLWVFPLLLLLTPPLPLSHFPSHSDNLIHKFRLNMSEGEEMFLYIRYAIHSLELHLSPPSRPDKEIVFCKDRCW